LIAAFFCFLQGCTQEQLDQGAITHDKALLLSRQAATERGYHLKDYSLLPSPNGDDLMPGGKEWFFLYVCKKPAPGCHFSVTVSRATGAVEVQPGA
jgi:hypothetical protein